MQKNKLIPEMTDDRILSEWKAGLTVTQISKLYMENKKKKRYKNNAIRCTKICRTTYF